ncbi:MAG: hypothetical protein HY528_01360 [Chloroflexi bacterium]|nr:hypothetical protein [Chloroflexota bacterium]
MASEGQDSYSITEAYKVQFERAHHLDRMALTTFTIVAVLSLALFAEHVLAERLAGQNHEALAIGLLSLALAVGGAHTIIANAGDYWVTFVLIGQFTRGLGLVQRGIFPASLLAQPPIGWWNYTSRLLGGFRGPLLVIYLTLGWYSGFIMFGEWLDLLPAFLWAMLVPLVLAAGSALFCYERMKHQMLALRRHEELIEASRDKIVDSHCDLAEALLWLDPPRLFHARKQYELALEIEPDNQRAKEGLQRVLSWKGATPSQPEAKA